MAEKKPDVSTTVPRTREEFEKALAERKALTTMLVPSKEPAGQAPAGAPPVRYSEPALPPSPPAPAVDVRPVEAAKKQKLDLIAAKVIEIRKAEVELEEQKRNAADLLAQMNAERQALAVTKEKLEHEVGELQSELAAAEARDLAAQAMKEQADRPLAERLPLEKWRERFREDLRPLVTRVVAGLVKLRAILTDKGATLETVAALRAKPGLDSETRSEYIAVSEVANRILNDLHARIREHERALAAAEDFVPDPRTPDGKTEINGLRHTLESVSGVVTNRLVDIPNPRVLPPSAGIEGQTPASLDLAERVAAVLTQYAQVQKRVNGVRRQPELVLEIIPKDSKPRHEIIAEQRPPRPTAADQSVAEGV